MQRTRKFSSLGLMLLLIVGLCGCDRLNVSGLQDGNISFGRNITPIGDLKPTQNQQATVYIQGLVEKRVSLLQRWAYQVNDTTGKIWVVTKQNNPKVGDSVVFKGKARYESILLAGEEFGEVYLVEE